MADRPPGEPVQRLIDRHRLQPHPEGGWYRETHRSPITIPRAALPGEYAAEPDVRCAVTSILFLLPTGARSRPHRIQSEEIWLHHQGDDLRLCLAAASDMMNADQLRLGQNADAHLQVVVPRRHWQAADALPGSHGYALVACVVAPGFEFADFELSAG